jgi:hypothetical protein
MSLKSRLTKLECAAITPGDHDCPSCRIKSPIIYDAEKGPPEDPRCERCGRSLRPAIFLPDNGRDRPEPFEDLDSDEAANNGV